VQQATQGTYAVVVTVLTNVNNVPVPPATFAATLSLLGAPQITTQPASQAVAIGSNVTFSVVATGNAPLSYQWKFNGGNLSGKTAPTLALNSVQPADDGNYTVVVSNPIGQATSQPALLSVLLSPVLTNAMVLPNGNFQAQLQGNPNRTYIIEVSSNLKDWSTLLSLVYTSGPMPFVDQTTNAPNRFYRARVTVP
jgi:Immunoglobulin domain